MNFVENEQEVVKRRFSTLPFGSEPGVLGDASATQGADKPKQGKGKQERVIVDVAGGLTADLTPGKHEVGKPL